MPPSFFAELLADLARTFAPAKNLEVSCEVNPATVDASWLRGAREAGITRVSIGVQSFQDRLLHSLGRVHSGDEAMRAIAEAQDAGFASVSLDLMFGILDETMSELEDDLRTAMTFQPEHLSVYQLTIEEEISGPGTRDLGPGKAVPGSRFLVPGSEESLLQQMRTGARMLGRSGWPRYEISNFAKPGFECRHNLNYWRYGEYLGLGAGATSFLRIGPGTGNREPGTAFPGLRSLVPDPAFARRFTQLRDVQAYMKGDAALAESEELDARTAMAEFCFLGLRTTEGISKTAFEGLFHISFDEVLGKVARDLVREKLIDAQGDRLALTPKGLELANLVSCRFLS
jgi:oxygen-independent coproporphyrinogen-3 oxidase